MVLVRIWGVNCERWRRWQLVWWVNNFCMMTMMQRVESFFFCDQSIWWPLPWFVNESCVIKLFEIETKLNTCRWSSELVKRGQAETQLVNNRTNIYECLSASYGVSWGQSSNPIDIITVPKDSQDIKGKAKNIDVRFLVSYEGGWWWLRCIDNSYLQCIFFTTRWKGKISLTHFSITVPFLLRKS